MEVGGERRWMARGGGRGWRWEVELGRERGGEGREVGGRREVGWGEVSGAGEVAHHQ